MKKPEFLFLPVEHEYYLDNVRIIGITDMLKSLGFYDYSFVRKETLNFKAEIGKQIHKARDLYDKGMLDEDSLRAKDPGDIDISGYMESWKKFVKAYKPKTAMSETPICSYKYRFGTTPDLVAKISGKLAIVEAKTTVEMSPVVALQTAGQQVAVEEWLKKKVYYRFGVQLFPDGREPNVKIYEDKTDRNVFLCMLAIENRKQAYGIKRRKQ